MMADKLVWSAWTFVSAQSMTRIRSALRAVSSAEKLFAAAASIAWRSSWVIPQFISGVGVGVGGGVGLAVEVGAGVDVDVAVVVAVEVAVGAGVGVGVPASASGEELAVLVPVAADVPEGVTSARANAGPKTKMAAIASAAARSAGKDIAIDVCVERFTMIKRL